MSLTALQEQGLGGIVGQYRGATTAVQFNDPQTELAALRGGCGVYDLGYRAKISLTGADRVRWLNGMVTNSIRDLPAGQGAYAFVLNPQGHILGDLYAYNRGESIVIDTDQSQREKMLATFEHYIIMDDVEVNDLSQSITALGIAGPRSREVMTSAGIAIPEKKPLEIFEATCTCDCECTRCTTVRSADPVLEAYELWLAGPDVKKTWDALVAHDATPIGSQALEMHRILNGIPLFGVDIRDRDLPQETEQARALNFNKGCYIGQEIVERIRSRGAVHRKFAGFVADAGLAISSGAKIFAGDKEVGEVTSVVSLRVPNPEKTVALGYIRRELGTPGSDVMIAGFRATIVPLPVPDGTLAGQAASGAPPA